MLATGTGPAMRFKQAVYWILDARNKYKTVNMGQLSPELPCGSPWDSMNVKQGTYCEVGSTLYISKGSSEVSPAGLIINHSRTLPSSSAPHTILISTRFS